MTYDELLQAYFSARLLRPDTKRSYNIVFNVLKHSIEDSAPDSLNEKQVRDWRQRSLDNGLSVVSWNSYMRHLQAVFHFGMEQGYLERTKSPFDGLMLTEGKRKKKTLSAEQISAVVNELDRLQQLEEAERLQEENAGRASPPWFWRTVLETLYHSGIRRNQLLHLRLMDVSLAPQALLHIRIEGSKTHREYDIPISDALYPWLEQLVGKAKAAGFASHEQLFNITRFKPGHRTSRQMTGEHIAAAFNELSQRVGFRVSPHRFRHTICTRLMRNPKANLHLVKELMGHSNISTTLQYIEPDLEQMRELLNQR